MRMAKSRIARRVGFEKCLIPWKDLIFGILNSTNNLLVHNANVNVLSLEFSVSPSLKSCIRHAVCYSVDNDKIRISNLISGHLVSDVFFANN